MAGKKGSTQFSRNGLAVAISASYQRLWSMLRCASRFLRIETEGAGFYQDA
jgi:hypothetical protein